jgi:demethylmenaquinone methyltransferase/2-methoxy-6-polyprenyl-1,4-benzoquinol methylase
MSNAPNRPEAAPVHPGIEDYYASPARRPSIARALFNRSARHYDLINRIFSLGSGAWYRRYCLRQAGVGPGMMIVDVAVGTGLLAREALTLMQGQGLLFGVDLSEAMLEIARKNLGIPLIQATAEALPIAPGTADFVTMGYALRHVADLDLTLREALRVLRPGGRVVLLEISAPSNRLARLAAGAIVGGVLPVLSLLLARDRQARALMSYHWRTIAAYAPPAAVLGAMRGCGFESTQCASELDLFHCYTGKKPENKI